jgi:hypothetical protein
MRRLINDRKAGGAKRRPASFGWAAEARVAVRVAVAMRIGNLELGTRLACRRNYSREPTGV